MTKEEKKLKQAKFLEWLLETSEKPTSEDVLKLVQEAIVNLDAAKQSLNDVKSRVLAGYGGDGIQGYVW